MGSFSCKAIEVVTSPSPLRTSEIEMCAPPPLLRDPASGCLIWTAQADEWMRQAIALGISKSEMAQRWGVSKNAVVGRAGRRRIAKAPKQTPVDLAPPPAEWAAWFNGLSPFTRNGMARRNHSGGQCPARRRKGVRHLWECTCGATQPTGRIVPMVHRRPLPELPPVVVYVPPPVRIVPSAPPRLAPETIPIKPTGRCQFPLWGHSSRPKFREDGRALLCYAPSDGVWCEEHRAVCLTRTAA
jgi:hypothetical protein